MLHIERVVITGGREYRDRDRISADLEALQRVGLRRIAHGGHGVPRGVVQGPSWWHPVKSADALAHRSALTLRVPKVVAHHVDVNVDGPWPAAGCHRNVRMLDAERPDLVLAYPDPKSRGTWHCVREAVQRGIPVVLWRGDLVITDDQIDPTWLVWVRRETGDPRWLVFNPDRVLPDALSSTFAEGISEVLGVR